MILGTKTIGMLKVQVGAVADNELRTLWKTATTRPILARRLDSPKRCIRTQMVSMPIIWVAHDAADLKRVGRVHCVPVEMVDRGLSRPLADNTAGIATWLDARAPSR